MRPANTLGGFAPPDIDGDGLVAVPDLLILLGAANPSRLLPEASPRSIRMQTRASRRCSKGWRTAGVGAPYGQEGQETKLCSRIGLPTVPLGVLAGFRWGARIHQTVALRF